MGVYVYGMLSPKHTVRLTDGRTVGAIRFVSNVGMFLNRGDGHQAARLWHGRMSALWRKANLVRPTLAAIVDKGGLQERQSVIEWQPHHITVYDTHFKNVGYLRRQDGQWTLDATPCWDGHDHRTSGQRGSQRGHFCSRCSDFVPLDKTS